MIGGFSWVGLVWLAASTIQVQVSDYGQLYNYTVWLQLYRVIMHALNTCEQIVMVMIKNKINYYTCKKKKITQELPREKFLAKQELEYSLTFDLFSTFNFYFQHSTFIFNIRFFLLNIICDLKMNF